MAARAVDAGELDYATTLYTSIPATTPRDCAVRGLHRIAIQRQWARDKVAAGQQELLAGNVNNAKQDFRDALSLDTSNSAAQQDLAQIARYGPPNSPVFSWNNFYANRVEAAYRLLGAFAATVVALLLLSSLASRWLVKVDAIAWPQVYRRCTKFFAGFLVVGASALLPIYPMFKPFMADDCPGWLLALVLLAIVVIFLVLWVLSYRRLATTHFSACDRGAYRTRFFWKEWRVLAITLVGLAVVVALLWFIWWNQAYPRLLLSAGAVLALAVVITAVSFGQNCRVQVQALGDSGRSDENATDFFLARIQTLGRERNQGLTASSASSAMTSLVSQDLSTIPAGFGMGLVARIVFTLRPDMTWRAQVTRFDDNRVAMRLSRNGRLAATTVFSRADLGLAPVNPPTADDSKDTEAGGQSVEQARAQLVTGAAAFVLMHLSTVYPEYRKGLSGATKWKSVTLQAIASSEALSANEEPQSLLRTALEIDPGNGRARYEYVNKRADDLPLGPLYDKIRVDMFRDLTTRAVAEKAAEDPQVQDKPKFGWAELYLRILTSASVARLNQRIEQLRASGRTEADPNQPTAAELTKVLTTRCKEVIQGKKDEPACCTAPKDECLTPADDDKTATARRLLPFAKNFEEFAHVLDIGKLAAKGEYVPYHSPGLSYDYAVLRALVVEESQRKGEQVAVTLTDELFNNLAFAVGSAKMKHRARTDENLLPMSYDERFFGIVGKPRFLDVKPFTPFRDALAKAELTTASRFLQATRTTTARADLAKYLNVPVATVDCLQGFAQISKIHPELEDPRWLNVLAGLDIENVADLEKRVRDDRDEFPKRVKSEAARQGLKIPSEEAPPPEPTEILPAWVQAVRRQSARATAKKTAAKKKAASKPASATGQEE